jgi:hypothetical protein
MECQQLGWALGLLKQSGIRDKTYKGIKEQLHRASNKGTEPESRLSSSSVKKPFAVLAPYWKPYAWFWIIETIK